MQSLQCSLRTVAQTFGKQGKKKRPVITHEAFFPGLFTDKCSSVGSWTVPFDESQLPTGRVIAHSESIRCTYAVEGSAPHHNNGPAWLSAWNFGWRICLKSIRTHHLRSIWDKHSIADAPRDVDKVV